MNFLAHYFTAKSDTNSYIILGALMPDFVKDFSRIYNHNVAGKLNSEDEYVNKMLAGVALHIKGDKIFHQHKVFLEAEAFAKEKLQANQEITVKRKFVIAHVVVELIIDHIIINKNPSALDELYNKLDTINIENANRFYEALNIDEKNSNFKKNLHYFRSSKFLIHLKENEGIIFTLDKVFGTIFDYNFKNQKALWNILIDEIKLEIKDTLPILLEDIKTKLYE